MNLVKLVSAVGDIIEAIEDGRITTLEASEIGKDIFGGLGVDVDTLDEVIDTARALLTRDPDELMALADLLDERARVHLLQSRLDRAERSKKRAHRLRQRAMR